MEKGKRLIEIKARYVYYSHEAGNYYIKLFDDVYRLSSDLILLNWHIKLRDIAYDIAYCNNIFLFEIENGFITHFVLFHPNGQLDKSLSF